jgi:uncharacterized membrane protein YbhN (UPF0104 family)
MEWPRCYITGFMLFIATYFIGIWALLLIILAVACTPFALRNPVLLTLVPARFRSLKLEYVGQLAVATLAQVCTLAAIFYVELHSISEKVALVPSLIYTGAANFALFVSITPGAIGFREAFLTLTRHFHGISTDLIVAANLLDRSVYLIFMALLALVVFGLHTGNYLKNK